jgi:hypothetical protein
MSFIPIRSYNKNQVIVTSDRLIFNAKEDNVFITAKKDLAISVKGEVHINTDSSFLLNSPIIQLGIKNLQPVPKGNELKNMQEQLLNALQNLATDLSSAIGVGVGTVSQPSINAAGTKLLGEISNIRSLLDKINSKITFTS